MLAIAFVQPFIDQAARNRIGPGQLIALFRKLSEVFAAEPIRFFYLIFIARDLFGDCARAKSEHEGRGKRPKLRSPVLHVGDGDAGFLHHFAGDGFFQTFARIDVTGEDGKTAFIALGPANRVAVVDVETYEVKKYILVGQRVWHLALTPEEDWLFTTNGVSNDVTAIDVNSLKAIKTIQVGRYPWGAAVRPMP